MINLLDIRVAMPNPEAEAQLTHLRAAYAKAVMPHQRVNIWLRARQDHVPSSQDEPIDVSSGAIPGLPLILGDLAAVLALAGDALLGGRDLDGDVESRAPLGTERACRNAYTRLLAARAELMSCEAAYFRVNTGRPA